MIKVLVIETLNQYKICDRLIAILFLIFAYLIEVKDVISVFNTNSL